ncbi:MAG: carbohydrate kinase family protein [Spirochaetales bacterium]|nr:carbohydrate kinase family protein [Spirochaetales bacterium]
MKYRINGLGCSLIDYLYTDVDFSSDPFEDLSSRKPGDGGISPGKLVFTEDLEQFSGLNEREILNKLVGNNSPRKVNLGGPAAVSLVQASQLLLDDSFETAFYGAVGNDETGKILEDFLKKFPLNKISLKKYPLSTPSTIVLSDGNYNNGAGERSFLNRIGAAGTLSLNDIPDDFYDGELLLIAGTALQPRLHQDLTSILERGKERGAFTIVGTVYDFYNEKKAPAEAWPLGRGNSYPLIDLLVTDEVEALRLSGRDNIFKAGEFFKEQGSKAFVITRGAEGSLLYAQGSPWTEKGYRELPISQYVKEDLEKNPGKKGDTTGCGDNFLGGLTAELAHQLKAGRRLDLTAAAVTATAAGGFACYYEGGAYFEKERGEKKMAIDRIAGKLTARITAGSENL